jgi:predicted lipoprotein
MTRFAFLSACVPWLLLGCSASSATHHDPRQVLLESWGEDVILSNYELFVKRSEAFADSAQTLCGEPSAESLGAARAAWSSAREAWKWNDVIKFGPYREQPLALGSKLDFWPPRPDAVQEVFAGDVELDDEALDTVGAPARGMPASELLLWDSEDAPEEAFASDGRRCEYLLALAADQVSLAEEMYDAWSPDGGNYVAELTDPENGEMFGDLKGALSEIVNRMAFALEDMRGDKLGRPLGEQSGGTPQPDLLESRPSARSIQDLSDTLTGIESIYFGAEKPKSAKGLSDYISTQPRDFNQEMADHLEACRAALAAIDPLERAIEEDADGVVAAENCLADLQTFIQVDIVNELGLTVSLNDADGD